MITKIEACKVLNVKRHTLNNFIKKGYIKSVKNKVDLDSLHTYKKELEDRRSVDPAKWVYINTAS